VDSLLHLHIVDRNGTSLAETFQCPFLPVTLGSRNNVHAGLHNLHLHRGCIAHEHALYAFVHHSMEHLQSMLDSSNYVDSIIEKSSSFRIANNTSIGNLNNWNMSM
jgi:hypothetical protein